MSPAGNTRIAKYFNPFETGLGLSTNEVNARFLQPVRFNPFETGLCLSTERKKTIKAKQSLNPF